MASAIALVLTACEPTEKNPDPRTLQEVVTDDNERFSQILIENHGYIGDTQAHEIGLIKHILFKREAQEMYQTANLPCPEAYQFTPAEDRYLIIFDRVNQHPLESKQKD